MHSSIIIIYHDLFYSIFISFEYIYYLNLFVYHFTLYLIYSFIAITIHSTLNWIRFVAVICINFIYSHIVCLLRLLIWDTNVWNVRISNTAHLMSSTFSERFKHLLFWTYCDFYVRSKIKWRPFVLVSEPIYRSWFCVYLRLRAVVQRKT